jgi:hypothetical protein
VQGTRACCNATGGAGGAAAGAGGGHEFSGLTPQQTQALATQMLAFLTAQEHP